MLRFWSGVEVLVCLYFGYVTADMLHDLTGRIQGALRREEDEKPSKLYAIIEEGLKK